MKNCHGKSPQKPPKGPLLSHLQDAILTFLRIVEYDLLTTLGLLSSVNFDITRAAVSIFHYFFTRNAVFSAQNVIFLATIFFTCDRVGFWVFYDIFHGAVVLPLRISNPCFPSDRLRIGLPEKFSRAMGNC